jgi:DNA-directed RNA polymerase subunit RPC12/RpoP
MTAVVCKCIQCKTELRFNVSGNQDRVGITCPKCSKKFEVKVAQPSPTTVAPLAKLTPQDLAIQRPAAPQYPSASSNQLPGFQQSQLPSFQASPHSSAGPTSWNPPRVGVHAAPGVNNGNVLKIVFLALGAVAALGLIIGVGFALYSNRDSLVSLANATKNVVRFDSPETIAQELVQLRDKVQQAATKIAEADRQSSGADKLMSYRAEFEAIWVRACSLATVSRSTEDLLSDAANRSKRLQELRKQSPNGPAASGGAQTFWVINLSADPNDKWQAAINSLGLAAEQIYATMDALVEYPHPQKLNPGVGGWSDEDRRCLAVYWLQGRLFRSLIQQVGPLSIKDSVSEAELKELFKIYDEIADQGAELAQIASTQGKVIIHVPKGTSYELQSRQASRSLEYLLARIKKAGRTEHKSLLEALKLGEGLGDSLEDIQFDRNTGIVKFSQADSWEAFQEHLKQIAEREKSQAAEEERQRLAIAEKELKEKEAAQLREQEREAKRRADEAARASQMANAGNAGAAPSTSGGAAGRFPGPMAPQLPRVGGAGSARANGEMAGPNMPPGQVGGPQFGGPQFGPNGPPGIGGRPGFPPRPGFGDQPGPGQNPGQIPMGQDSITIIVNNVNNEQYQQTAEQIRKRFSNHSINFSGGRMTIQISDFKQPLAELESIFPQMKFQSIDQNKRSLQATMK